MLNTANTFSKNWLFIGKKDGASKRGSYTLAHRLAQLFSSDFIIDSQLCDLSYLPPDKNKYIFLHQACEAYSFNFDISLILKLPHVVFTRDRLYAQLFNSASNGFSYYNNKRVHKNYIPLITNFGIDTNSSCNCKDISIGFYERVNITPDAVRYLQYEIDNSSCPINLVTCGSNTTRFTGVTSHYHTTNSQDFFSRITHYYFPMSAEFEDPFPCTLLEAIQTGKQIICPRLPKRKHTDGIDDILQLIKYHNKLDDAFSDVYYDNKNHGLTEGNFQSFYARLVENDFSNYLDYDKYNNFYDWCSKEL